LTIRDWLRWGVTRFNEAKLFFGHGSDNAFDEVAYLIAHVLGLPLEHLDAFLDARLTDSEKKQIQKFLERRIEKRIPAAYLTNEAWLGDFRFYVDERVIIPRSFLAELYPDGLDHFQPDHDAVRSVLDLCTGSGCLAIMLAYAYPKAEITAADISTDALAVAQKNIRDYDLAERIDLIHSNLMEKLPEEERYDLIVSNPPYVTDRDLNSLPREYCHEPRIALSGGDDGMKIVRYLIKNARKYLHPHGVLVVEVGYNREFAEDAFPDLPFFWLETHTSTDSVFVLRYEDLPE